VLEVLAERLPPHAVSIPAASRRAKTRLRGDFIALKRGNTVNDGAQ
jgi:hypothetical protein